MAVNAVRNNECPELQKSPTLGHNSTSDSLFLREKINDLIDKLQAADSKSKAFFAECTLLKQRLELAEKARRSAEEELSVVKQSVTQLNEELNTTAVNYQHQLSTMSEHLATLNEKLTSQKDEIESLKAQLKNRRSRR